MACEIGRALESPRRLARVALLAVVAVPLQSCAARPLATSMPIPAPTVRPFADGREWLLVEPLIFQVGDSGPTIIVPAGFVTDFATVPHVFWSIIAPHGYHGRAAIVHDFLYWDQACSREEADGLFLLGMATSKVDRATLETMYAGARSHGMDAWRANARDRARGMPRVIPKEFWTLPADARWSHYRQKLFDLGVRADTLRSPRQPYCDIGAPSGIAH